MNRRIFVIHSSEIIRKGMLALLRSYFNVEITLLENSDRLEGYRELRGQEIVIIDENYTTEMSKAFIQLNKRNRVKWIAFLNDSEVTARPLPFCKFFITPRTDGLQLQQMVSRCWDTTRRQPRPAGSEELTAREKDVLRLVALGHSNKAIAEMLFISVHTVISHRKNITEKTGIKSISGLTVFAILNNLIDTSSIHLEDLI
jgi:DNA-binding CsgD family transcriptional regulator